MSAKTAYQNATGAEETCKECPHTICPKRDEDAFECPARVGERACVKAYALLDKAYSTLANRYKEALRGQLDLVSINKR